MHIGAFKNKSREILQFHKRPLYVRTMYVMYGVATTPTAEHAQEAALASFRTTYMRYQRRCYEHRSSGQHTHHRTRDTEDGQ